MGEYNRQGPNRVDKVRVLRVCLEAIFLKICIDESRSFGNLFAQMCFVSDKYNVPERVKDEAHSFRKLANKVAHRSNFISEKEFVGVIQALSWTVRYFSSVPIPDELRIIYANYPKLTLIQEPQELRETEVFDRAVVVDIFYYEDSNKYVITCESENELGRYKINLRDQTYKNGKNSWSGQQFSEVGKILWKYATIHVFNISKDNTREREFHAYYQSLLVVEPDFLVDATFLARSFFERKTEQGKVAFSNPLTAYLDRLNGVKPNHYLFTGALANEFLDEHLIQEHLEFVPTFKNAVRSQVWNAINVGEAGLRKIRDELRERHIPNLMDCRPELLTGNAIIEPAFFSALYGLQGRLDVMVTFENDPLRKEIYELKSGRPPEQANEVKAEHEMQVIAYNMLLKSAYGNSRKGASAILYSKAKHTPLRNVDHNFRIEQDLMMARNKLVAMLYQIAGRKFQAYKDVQAGKFGPTLSYDYCLKNFRAFKDNYNNASPTERAYFNEFTAFIIRELQTGKVGDTNPREGNNRGFAGLWHYSEFEKRSRFDILTDLTFRKQKTDSSEFEFTIKKEQFSNFRDGDIALIYPYDSNGLKPLNYQILKCSVLEITPTKLVIRLRNKQINQDLFKDHTGWVLEHDFLDKSYYSMLQSMNVFLQSSKEKKDLILGLKTPEFEDRLESLDAGIMVDSPSRSQGLAIQRAFAAKDFFLIQGPPGTGKTSRVLTYILLHLYRHTTETIVILAFTNKAVEKILQHLDEFNQKQGPGQQVDYLHLASALKDSPKSLTVLARKGNFRTVQKKLFSTRVFIGTVAAFQSHQNLIPTRLQLDTLIIDEASQLIEPQVAGIIPRFQRFVMIGDHNQLPAITTQREAKCKIEVNHLQKIGLTDLSVSFFERLWKQAINKAQKGGTDAEKWAKSTLVLEEHFRMHKEIADLVNPYYDNRLKLGNEKRQTAKLTHETNASNPLVNLLANNRVIFLESPKGEGKSHAKEAGRVKKLLEAIQEMEGKKFDPTHSVGVITPWRAQINRISKEIGNDRQKRRVTLDTVERFQGSERGIIIISLATSEPVFLSILGSLMENEFKIEVDRKLNVSISRAEEQLIILGEPDVLMRSPHYARVIKAIMDNGKFCDLEETEHLFDDAEELEEDSIF
ncbi:MAG TPA: DEAD/DEAH box helicase [Bacteroidetes bacterium]|nr:DEAD/DEAH box helicase [Bacteroidota bacterium]